MRTEVGERASLFASRLIDAANAVSSGDFHPGEVKNLLREAAAKLVGYEAFVEAGTKHAEGGDPIWQYYDEKLWRDILFWKERALQAERTTVQGVLDLIETVGTLHVADDAILPHSNGYSCWFVGQGQLGTAPLTVDEILARIEARRA